MKYINEHFERNFHIHMLHGANDALVQVDKALKHHNLEIVLFNKGTDIYDGAIVVREKASEKQR